MIFDRSFYLAQNQDVHEAGIDPQKHFKAHGRAELRNPHPLIDLKYIASQLEGSDSDPLDALSSSGSRVNPSPIFDVSFVADQLGLGSEKTSYDILEAFLDLQDRDAIRPNLLFLPAFVARQIEVPEGSSALEQYLAAGWTALPVHPLVEFDRISGSGPHGLSEADGRTMLEALLTKDLGLRASCSPLFDAAYYAAHSGCEEDTLVGCLTHYLREGENRGLRPNPYFNPRTYADAYMGGGSTSGALEHYALNGREPHITLVPDFSHRFYHARNPGVDAYSRTPLDHYLRHGLDEGRIRQPSPPWLDDFASWDFVRDDVRSAFSEARTATPQVCVVIPVFDQFNYTLRCVWSILKAKEQTPIEIIIADDGSTDETEQFFGSLPGLTYFRNPENLGFLRNCNAAAAQSKAPFVYFLNNDTAVLPGWIDRLMDTMDRIPEAGLVGSKLVYPNGLLQESGGMIWRDGGGANIGRYSDASEPGYNTLRDVDYVSGAGIMVRRTAWDRLGGFDERYVPAYCEDSDLAMALRQHGYRVLVNPSSAIVHFEGISLGRSVQSGIKSYQVVNQQKLREKWEFALERHLPAQQEDPRELGENLRPRILIIDAVTPRPDHDAGSVTSVWFMKLLVQLGYDVTFVAQNLLRDGHYSQALQDEGIELLYMPYVTNLETYIRNYGHRFDLFFLYRVSAGGHFARSIQRLYPKTPIIFDTVDLHFLRMEREAKLGGSRPEELAHANEVRRMELGLIETTNATIILSQAEREVLQKLGHTASLSVIPLVLESQRDVAPRKGRTGIAFVGGYQHTPNVDAVVSFIEEIWPDLHEACPDLIFHIVGSHPPAEILELEGANVIVEGFVEDLDGFLAQRIATIAPLKYGAGIKGKIGSSLAAGVPCIATTIAAEGMGLEDGKEILIADGASATIDAVKNLIKDDKAWKALSQAGLKFVDRNFAPRAIRRQLFELFAKADVVPFRGTCPISGMRETRRFDSWDRPKSLRSGPDGSDVAERVLAQALISSFPDAGSSLHDWQKAPTQIFVQGECPVLEKALSEKGALSELETAGCVVVELELSNQTATSISDILMTLPLGVSELKLACTPKRETHAERVIADAEAISEIVFALKASEHWDVRTDRFALPDCALTGTVLIEARRRHSPDGET
ncbi:GT2 family glycosyltransferase [Litoreibacter ponti]|uniref:GT2 family glycosyltransferase n=1 Tax=Litoreibacter ponti TaxID=1510457 RepID=A0A2T6BP24_9RHOB|nr:glycosyltransferase [Litoreibacter ponti]PTX57737.1 GT2 family glycosyltransferase [Litoreibacter ponti]